ncbi:MAG: 1-(5-phosphoribosyl)-5-[(5-phosphoribosylamino)methylideneamino]imidazole-4-carboxamide isomerase [Candidatus Omnitrophica bacterium]|nr:1-(5-phosphoribosyl)-5-[(5-phosphoribosylamino)methylideneamino]imidazole-4-carboxamide isomerase [Candidatus Omnitrophota bacterium]
MLIIPAIDLKGGKVVRLVRGDFSEELVYADDPVAVARKWAAAGARRLHVIDLDGALTGTPRHLEAIAKIAKAVEVPVQAGGGIRTVAAIAQILEAGVAQVILGTKACLDEAFVTRALKAHGERIAVAVDVKGGRVAIEGWVRKEWMKPEALIRRLVNQGVKTLIYTDASRDGTMTGPSVETLKEILKLTQGSAACFASGGISSLEDLVKLKELIPSGLSGVVVGRALYEEKLDLPKALELCSPKESSPASIQKPAGSSKASGSSG